MKKVNNEKFFKNSETKKLKQASIYIKEKRTNNERSKAMNSQDIAKIGHKVKRETEAFINHYINDRAKGWPVICRSGSACN